MVDDGITEKALILKTCATYYHIYTPDCDGEQWVSVEAFADDEWEKVREKIQLGSSSEFIDGVKAIWRENLPKYSMIELAKALLDVANTITETESI